MAQRAHSSTWIETVQGFQTEALAVALGATSAASLLLTELCWAQAWLNPSRDWDLGPKSSAEQNSGSQGRGVEFRGSSRGVTGEGW